MSQKPGTATASELFAPAHFAGWLRLKGQRWKLVCEAATWSGCWDILYAMRPPGNFCEKWVMEAGQHPKE